ncbi:MAG: hypothetical protein Q7V10_08450 [Methanobacteriaceae archaeon]|nr:hypothetical protein [Methanobacteriaceae archaeon]MDO9627076.1 hypothetical protein [Methanobacteriaceae archaeon]
MCVKTSLDLNHFMTTEIKELLREVESLDSENLIIINEMCDKELLKQSAGAAVHRDTNGNDIISLDPKRADEHALAHEIMHIKLHRSGWSQIYSMIPDNFARNLADKMDNLIDHHVFYPELKSTGIDISGYLDTFTVGFDYWTRSEDKELDILNNGLDACQGLLFGEPYKTRTIESIEKNILKA